MAKAKHDSTISSADPIFTALDAHRRARAALSDVLDAKGKQEELEFAGKPYDKAALEQANRDELAAGKALWETEKQLAATVPSTLAGILTVLKYTGEFDDGVIFTGEDHLSFIHSLTAAVASEMVRRT
jgi:hypothetical protein